MKRQNKKTQLRCERGAKINEPCDTAANEEHGECPYFCDAKRRCCAVTRPHGVRHGAKRDCSKAECV